MIFLLYFISTLNSIINNEQIWNLKKYSNKSSNSNKNHTKFILIVLMIAYARSCANKILYPMLIKVIAAVKIV